MLVVDSIWKESGMCGKEILTIKILSLPSSYDTQNRFFFIVKRLKNATQAVSMTAFTKFFYPSLKLYPKNCLNVVICRIFIGFTQLRYNLGN